MYIIQMNNGSEFDSQLRIIAGGVYGRKCIFNLGEPTPPQHYGNNNKKKSIFCASNAPIIQSDGYMDRKWNLAARADHSRRFLVTKDKTLMAMGSTTKYLEVLYDGSDDNQQQQQQQ
eukprot:511736_1